MGQITRITLLIAFAVVALRIGGTVASGRDALFAVPLIALNFVFYGAASVILASVLTYLVWRTWLAIQPRTTSSNFYSKLLNGTSLAILALLLYVPVGQPSRSLQKVFSEIDNGPTKVDRSRLQTTTLPVPAD